MKALKEITFRQLFALTVLVFTYLVDLLMLFIRVPAENKELINIIIPLLNSGAFIVIIQYYFGNSHRGTTAPGISEATATITTKNSTDAEEQTFQVS